MKLLSLVLLIFSLLLGSCSQLPPYNHLVTRLPASETDQISYYLSIDKFKYYINEYSIAFEGKIPDEIISELRKIKPTDLLKMSLSEAELSDAQKYDDLIYKILKSKNLVGSLKKEELKWNYNFFRNKLNEAFTLTPSKLDIDLTITESVKGHSNELPVDKALYKESEMTLDSGHYISNRTTRAIFWEAIENDRTIEFHLGDSREFLKSLKSSGGEILYEVRPLAKNYNKIFIVKYPGDASYRYAITNIGGNDRLNHLTNQLSLSNLSGGKIKQKVVVKGNIEEFHARRAEEHLMHLRQLPSADRVIIGQKESIDGKFNLFWKVRALKNLYDEEPHLFQDVPPETLSKYKKVIESNFEVMFKDKSVIEDMFTHVEHFLIENPERYPVKFKTYNFDNFTIEMCDYVFQNDQNKTIRWRVISNVWGDEVVPIARALKSSGHTQITYMGTAGAFANKSFKVGDLVIPENVVISNKKIPVKANTMKIDIAKYGGSVEHVGSPFEETVDWLKMAQARSEFVEVETSYLREIFNSPKDNLEIYLLISDILGSDSETLAHATSSKRKNAQNKLLAELFLRDSKKIPEPTVALKLAPEIELKKLIDQTLAKKSLSFRYYIYSKLKNHKKPSKALILETAEKEVAFTDSFLVDRLVGASEILTKLKKETGTNFDLGFNRSVIDGTWNPKTEKLQILVTAKNKKDETSIKIATEDARKKYPSLFKTLSITTDQVDIAENLAITKLPEKIDPDTLLKIYTFAGFKNYGIYKTVSYNGTASISELPIAKIESPWSSFSLLPNTPKPENFSTECDEMVKSFLMIIN